MREGRAFLHRALLIVATVFSAGFAKGEGAISIVLGAHQH